MKPTLTVLCGLQGSGKSTYARKLEKKGYFVVSSDEIRKQYPNAKNDTVNGVWVGKRRLNRRTERHN